MGHVCNLRFEPAVYATCVEDVVAERNLSYWNPFNELFKADYAFSLLELIYSLVVGFLFYETY